jgi:hypothetical protein
MEIAATVVAELRDPREIYQCGADKLNDVPNWCAELGIAAVTLGYSQQRTLNDHQVRFPNLFLHRSQDRGPGSPVHA